MTRAPLTLGHLACCLPLQPLHTENACVYVHKCHGQQPLTRNTALRQKEITERKGVGEARFGKKEEDKKSDGGAPEHACVKRLCHECDEVIDGRVLCAKGHPPLYPLFFLNFPISPILRTHLCFFGFFFPRETLVLHNFTLSTGLGRDPLPNKVTRQSAAHYIIYKESTRQLHTNPWPARATAQQE